VFAPDTPRLVRFLLAATVVCLAGVLARNLGVVPPVLAGPWNNLYNAVEILSVAACVVRAVRSSGAERAAWGALAAGLLLYLGGDLYWTIFLTRLDAPPYPSPSDAGYIAIYPAAYVGLVLLLRSRAGRISPSLWLDGLICALTVAAVGAALVLGVVASTDGSLAAVATNLAYPLGDLALLAFVVAVLIVAGRRAGGTWLLIGAGIGVFAIVDTIYLWQAAVGTYDEYTLLDTGWPASFVLVAFAAWQPRRSLDARRLRSGAMLALPAGAALLSLGLLIFDHYIRLNELALWLAAGALAVCVARFALTFRENLQMLRTTEHEATTDALTGLGNRRALIEDLERAADEAEHGGRHVLALFDLDGFKSYNDAFGHPAGDSLLERLGRNLTDALGDAGTAYRMGGDEFCLLAPVGEDEGDAIVRTAAAALGEEGRSFRVGCSYGTVWLELGSQDPVEALRLADQRMYAAKRNGRRSTAESVHQVLLGVVGEHDGALHDHVVEVAGLAEQVGVRLGLDPGDLAHLRRAAALHDIGKVAIPDAILHAPRSLTDDEWGYIRQHTVIGARIISAAPELLPVAEIVRSSHERFDGGGYPDRLAGEEIPLGARIVAVCDSFEAMTTTRAYRKAMAVGEALVELERCSGTQFDPRVVAAFFDALAERADQAEQQLPLAA
jgi:diguanylate cyclase (GGDEF)-like protein/putative nucleotidyltransferase with HDIG domain